MKILIVNAGSSSLKYQLVDMEDESVLAKGLVERIGMEGSKLTHDQTRLIFETNTIGGNEAVRVDDVVETANHFRCIDRIIDSAAYAPSETLIKQLHATLKNGTSDARQDWFAVGEYKKLPNEVGGRETTAPD